MAKKKSSSTESTEDSDRAAKNSRVSVIARKPITLGPEFAEYMSALMSDVVLGDVSPEVANAGCNAGGKLLKYAELCMKYGKGQPFRLPAPKT